MTERRIGEVMLSLDSISLSFGGVRALTEISFDVREHGYESGAFSTEYGDLDDDAP